MFYNIPTNMSHFSLADSDASAALDRGEALNFIHLGGVRVDDHNRILKQKKIEQENWRFMKPSNFIRSSVLT